MLSIPSLVAFPITLTVLTGALSITLTVLTGALSITLTVLTKCQALRGESIGTRVEIHLILKDQDMLPVNESSRANVQTEQIYVARSTLLPSCQTERK